MSPNNNQQRNRQPQQASAINNQPAMTRSQKRNAKRKEKRRQQREQRANAPVLGSAPARLSAENSLVAASRESQLSSAIKDFVMQYMDPQESFVSPKFGSVTMTSILARNRIPLSPVDGNTPFEGVIKIFKDKDVLMQITSKGSASTFPGGELGFQLLPAPPLIMPKNLHLSFPATFLSGSTVIKPVKLHTDDLEYLAYNIDHKRFDAGYIWALPIRCTTTTTGLTFDVEIQKSDGTINPGGGTFKVQSFTDEGDVFRIASTALTVTVSQGTTQYTGRTLAATASGSYMVITYDSLDDIPDAKLVSFGNSVVFPAATNGWNTYEVPVESSDTYKGLERSSEGYCIETIVANFGWAGGTVNCSGQVACATVPHGKNIDDDPQIAINQISKLCPTTTYMSSDGESGNITKGCRSVLTGGRLRDFELNLPDEKYKAPYCVIAWTVPPAGSAQPPEVVLTVTTVISFVVTDPVYRPVKAPSGWDLVQAWADFQASHNLNTSNGTHLKKYAQIASAAVKNPKIRQAANLALQVAKVVGPTLMPRLGGVLGAL